MIATLIVPGTALVAVVDLMLSYSFHGIVLGLAAGASETKSCEDIFYEHTVLVVEHCITLYSVDNNRQPTESNLLYSHRKSEREYEFKYKYKYLVIE